MQFNFCEITQGMNIQAFTNESDRVTQGSVLIKKNLCHYCTNCRSELHCAIKLKMKWIANVLLKRSHSFGFKKKQLALNKIW